MNSRGIPTHQIQTQSYHIVVINFFGNKYKINITQISHRHSYHKGGNRYEHKTQSLLQNGGRAGTAMIHEYGIQVLTKEYVYIMSLNPEYT